LKEIRIGVEPRQTMFQMMSQRLCALDLTNFDWLSDVRLAHNRFVSLPVGFRLLSRLERVTLNNNRLTSLDNLDFKRNSNLITLDVRLFLLLIASVLV
jgi:Leucine-rich repeat (LRR) protein